jgi:hypothetical protein
MKPNNFVATEFKNRDRWHMSVHRSLFLEEVITFSHTERHGYITPAYLADDTSIEFPPGDPSSDRNIRNLCPYS